MLKTTSLSSPVLGNIKALIGLCQGIAIYFLSEKFVCPELFVLVLFVPLIIVQALGNMRTGTLIIWSLSLVAILSLLTEYNIWRTGLGHDNSSIPIDFFFVCGFALFIAQPLVSACDIDQKWYPSYTTCFDVSWKLATQIILSISFLGISWALLGLSTLLLNYVSVPLRLIVEKPWFPLAFNASVFAIALHLTDVKLAMLRALRVLYLNVVSALLPITVLVVTIFLIGLVVRLVTHTGKTISVGVIEGVFLFLIVEINAVYLDGKNAKIQGTSRQRYTAFAAKYLLVPLIVIIFILRIRDIAANGISVYYINELVFISILALYAIGYAIAAVDKQNWLKGLELCNYIAALTIIAAIIALYSPLLDPARIAISFQNKEFVAGDHNALNTRNLVDGLRWGKESAEKYHLKSLENFRTAMSSVVPPAAILKTPPPPPPPVDKTKRINLHGPAKVLPETFMQQDWETLGLTVPCLLSNSSPTCEAWLMKLTDDQQEGILIYSPDQRIFFYLKLINNSWWATGYWKLSSFCPGEENVITKDLFRFVKIPEMPNIDISGFTDTFVPNRRHCPPVTP